MNPVSGCWCGNQDQLVPFSEDYFLCPACHTLVWRGETDPSSENAMDDDTYYSFDYWLEHQNDLGLPDIHTRAHTDFIDRIPYWVHTILKYALPPGKAIDVGSSHGGLVALMKEAGFDATGLEVSPDLAEFAQKTFGVNTLAGYIEDQQLEAGTFDVLTLMDVVEHLENPPGTVKHCASLLKRDGVIVIQTPSYPDHSSYAELVAANHPVLKMMLPREHRYIFSRGSLQQLLQQTGFVDVRFEQALFEYDMFCFAGKETLSPNSMESIRAALLKSPSQRFSLAMVELFDEKEKWSKKYLQADLDRVERLKVIEQDAITATNLQNKITELENQVKFLNKQNTLAQRRITGLEELIAILRNSNSYKILTRLRRLSWFDEKARQLMAAAPIPMTKEDVLALRNYKLRLAIDLTPVRPGGENGGAKIMALNLIKLWSEILAPQWEFVLLTSEITHEELSWLDRPNVTRECVNFNAPQPQPTLQKQPTLRERVREIYQKRVPISIQLRLGTMKQRISESSKSAGVLKKVRADILFCPFTAPFYYDPDVPIVLVVHDLQFLYYPSFFTPEDMYHTNRYFQQSVAVANRLICVSDFTCHTVLENSNISKDRLEVVRSCLFTPIVKVDKEQVNRIINERKLEKEKYLFFPANFWQHKNHHMLILSFSQFLKQNPLSELKLVFSGAPGPRMDFLRESVDKFGLKERVIFLGFVKDEELAAIYQACKAVIFPSLFEGFGVPVLEGMSFGKPVLCSSVTSLPEVGGEAVLYFDPRKIETIVDAIQQIESNDTLRRELAERGLLRSREFGTTESWASKYLDVLCQVYVETRI